MNKTALAAPPPPQDPHTAVLAALRALTAKRLNGLLR